MVGGWVIEIMPVRPGVSRLWCTNPGQGECAVFVEDATVMPKVGDEVWWQAGRVYFDNDRRSLKKIANSFDPSAKDTTNDQ